MPHQYELIEHDGKLAIYHLTLTEKNKPAYSDYIWLSDIPAKQYRDIIGRIVWFPNGIGIGQVSNGFGGNMRIDATGWQTVKVEREIPRPRNGKEYGWKWGGFGEWVKDYFQRCDECGKYHDPEFTFCELCETCHKPGAKCKPATCVDCGSTFKPDGVSQYSCPSCR
jgi:hypothetical protein